MKNLEIVWRTLADSALSGKRNWKSLREISEASGVAPSTTHQALGRLIEIGAVEQNPISGLTVVSPQKLLESLAAERSLQAKALAYTTLDAAKNLLANPEFSYALGGTLAAVHHLGGENKVATHGQRIIYTPQLISQSELPESDEVIILKLDPLAARTWTDGFTSLAQTYADLWASPGWQSAEFLEALKDDFSPTRDWEQKSIA